MNNSRGTHLKKLALLLVVAAAATGAWALLARQPAAPEGQVTASGTIEATETDVSPKLSGHIVRLMVDEGDEVTAGQLIATLDGAEVNAQAEQAAGALDAAKARLADLERGTRVEDIRRARASLEQAEAAASGARTSLRTANEAYSKNTEVKARYANARSAYEAARHARDQAKARLAEIENGTRPEEIRQAEAAVARARADSTNAAQDAQRAEKLHADGAISEQARDTAIARSDAAAATLASAEARLAELRTGARPEQREQARAALAQATAALEGTRQNYEAVRELYTDRLALRQQAETAKTAYETALKQADAARAQYDLAVAGPTKEAVSAARGQVEQARGALDAAKAAEQYLTIRAPACGTVILKAAEPGELVVPGMPIVRIASLDSVWVRVYVPLTELQVRGGDRADVTCDSYPGRKFPGKVAEVSSKPEFTPKNVQTHEQRVKLVYGVKIRLSNSGHDLKPGMPADATIYLDSGRRKAR